MEVKMLINSDFAQRAEVHAADLEWVPSPMVGVERRMLDRIGHEVARATSIVRYAEGSSFSPHTHSGGEEFLVLDGVFQDEHGDYPEGSYVRNPPESRHTPGADLGCVIFVKLHQFDPEDRTFVRTNVRTLGKIADPQRPGVAITPLFEDPRETVQFETIESNTSVCFGDEGGAELLVVDGQLTLDHREFKAQSWLRLPPGDEVTMTSSDIGARVWVKKRHLRPEVLRIKSFNEEFGARR